LYFDVSGLPPAINETNSDVYSNEIKERKGVVGVELILVFMHVEDRRWGFGGVRTKLQTLGTGGKDTH